MIVTDASVWVSFLFSTDAFHARSQTWVQHALANGQTFVVPNIVIAEVAGAVARRSGAVEMGQDASNRFMTSTFFDIREVDRDLAFHAADVAATLSLKGADAIYVALAHRLGRTLVTWDREQIECGAAIANVMTPDGVSDSRDATERSTS